jgi:ankyrin repeat protein
MILNPVGHSNQVQVEHHVEVSRENLSNIAAAYSVLSQIERTVGTVLSYDSELIGILIRYGHNPDGIPALHYAIKMDDERAVRLLLEHGAHANSFSVSQIDDYIHRNLMYPLDYAALSGNAKTVQLLIDYGADVNPLMPGGEAGNIYYRGCNPLFFAAFADREEAVRVLIANGAALKAPSQNQYFKNWESPYRIAAVHGSVRAFKVLLENSPDIDPLVSEPVAALYHAASSGSTEIVRLLLERGAYVDTHTYGMTPLMQAKGACVELLLNAGANPKAKDAYGRDALYFFSLSRNLHAARAILKYGLDVNVNRDNSETGTPFLTACSNWQNLANDKEYLHLLLDNGADINARVNGKTALTRAKTSNKPELVNWLIQHGAKE